MNFGDLLKPVAKYAEKQAKDGALYVAFRAGPEGSLFGEEA